MRSPGHRQAFSAWTPSRTTTLHHTSSPHWTIRPFCEHGALRDQMQRANRNVFLDSASAKLVVIPNAKRCGPFRRLRREQILYALPNLLIQHSDYFKYLLDGDFQEAIHGKGTTDNPTSGVDAAENSASEYLEDWQSYFSDSDAEYADDDNDGDEDDHRQDVRSRSISAFLAEFSFLIH